MKNCFRRVHRTRKNAVLKNLPNFPAKNAGKTTQNPREKLPQQSFQQKVFFLKLFSGRHRMQFWQQCRSFAVKLLNLFRFKSLKRYKIKGFSKKNVSKVSLGNLDFGFDNVAYVFLPNFWEKLLKLEKNYKNLKKTFSPIVPLNTLNAFLRTMVTLHGQNFDKFLFKTGEKAESSAKKLVK